VRVSRFGLPDVFPDRYGSQDELFAYYGMTAQAIADLALTPVPGAV
jgi:transketolase C-terminal domain/subunit